MDHEILKTGTTTVGIVCKDGIILAADKRITTSGGNIVGDADKVVPVGNRFVLTMAGTVSDAVMLTRYIRSEIKLKELRSGNQVTVREAANLLAQFVYSNIRKPSMIPGVTHFLFAGYDKQGTELYDLFPDGSIKHIDQYFCSGSGSVYAYGVIDAEYNPEITTEQGVELAKKAIRSAIMRDTASGNGYDISVITKDGVVKHDTVVFKPQIQ